MSVNAVGPAVTAQPKSKLEKTAIAASIGAVAGAAIQGGQEYVTQSKILKNPKEVLANIGAQIKSVEKYTGDFFSNSEVNKIEAEKLKGVLKKLEDFISNGKVDFKTVGKRALVGAGIAAAAWGVIYFAGKSITDAIKGDKKAE